MVVALLSEGIARNKTVPLQSLNLNILLHLIPFFTLNTDFNIEQILTVREVSAAILNISGRQRMLSQRIALFALRLTLTKSLEERESLQSQLHEALTLMERSHRGLIEGDILLNLPGKLSVSARKIYFDAPYELDRQVREFLAAGKIIADTSPSLLNGDNPYLQTVIRAAESDLLEALDAAVSQYQKEKEEQEAAIDLYQTKLYKETCTAMAVAQARSQELGETLAKLQNTQIQLIQAEKLSGLGQLVAGVAHEINNPLGFLCGNLEYTKTYVSDLIDILKLYQQYYPKTHPEIQKLSQQIELDYLLRDLPESLETMKVGVDRIQEVVLNLRNFSRLDEIKTAVVNPHDCIESTLAILRYRFNSNRQERPIKIVRDYARLPNVECYPSQLNQVLMNLIGNAIDALEGTEEEPTIAIRTEHLESNPQGVTIRIADNGMGMTEDVKKKLFVPFFTTKPIGKGTGLGLSICYQIVVERHGGKLICRSHPGEGTEFAIYIPIRQKE